MAVAPASLPQHWDIFCRVIDNHGDLGVCWRLCGDLAARGVHVRLWVDDASALAWMAPEGHAGVELRAWPAAAELQGVTPGEVVVEAFGCELPTEFVARMAQLASSPRWINLEYLSAEDYVERSHGLPSPQFSGPGRGLIKHFFYPGFSAGTGGLLREMDLQARQADFNAEAWLAGQGLSRRPGARLVSLFGYPGAPAEALTRLLADQPTLLLACPGALRDKLVPGPNLRIHALPYLSQFDYDHLLWACDWNFVRGEDSFVRAQWAGKPMVWHIYPQSDGAHAAKLEAFMARSRLPAPQQALWRGWNGLAPLPDKLPYCGDHATGWRAALLAQGDLVTQLAGFLAALG